MGTLSKTSAALDTLTGGADGVIQLDTTGGFSHSAGQLSYDPVSKTTLADTGFSDVRVNVGQEIHTRFFNDTGVTITNGSVVNAAGVDTTNSVLKGVLADASSAQTSSSVIGLATHDVADQTVGLATGLGEVRDFDTSAFSVGGIIYASETPGELTATRPTYPAKIVIMGSIIKAHATEGIAYINPVRFSRLPADTHASFTSQGIAAGVFYKKGFYDWDEDDANLTQASTSVTHGVANRTVAAHVGIVPSGAGSVDAGQVGLRVVGTLDSETGTQTAAQTGIITTDITTLSANTMVECSEKFSGDVTIEFYTVSGSPTTYSLDFNYGFSKYWDFVNRDATVLSFEAQWQGNGNDSAMNIRLLHHKAAGWTYAATGFAAGDGTLCERLVDQQIEGDVDNNQDGAYKRVDIDYFVNSSASEGVIIEVTTGTNSTIQTMDLTINAVSEELT